MSSRRRVLVLGLVLLVAGGGFLWHYGDSLGGVDTATPEGEELVRGWQQVDVPLPELADTLPGVAATADGLPREGSYLVNFWASFCAPCKEEMPWLETLHDTGEVTVVGITRDNLLAEALKVIDRRGVTYPNLRDEFGDFMVSLEVVPPALLPSSFIVEDGRVTWTHLGPFASYDDLYDSVTSRL